MPTFAVAHDREDSYVIVDTRSNTRVAYLLGRERAEQVAERLNAEVDAVEADPEAETISLPEPAPQRRVSGWSS